MVEENKEEIERKLEDTRRQVQKEILEKINGLEHQLHRTSIADSGDYSTSPGIPLQNSTLMHAERSVHKILKPPTYDGQSSWYMYRRQFEAAAKANGWTSQEMATSLVISLRGQALEILQSIPEEQQNDYESIIGALEIGYGHKYLRQVYQSQIKSRQQKSNESLQEYEADIERLIHLANPQAPKEFLEQIGIQTFIDGLVDFEMQQALRLGRHTTISDALVAALEFKDAKEASRSYKSRDLRERMDRIHRFAREKLKIHSDKMKQRLDTTSTETAFKPGDAVWLYAPKRTKGKSPKLQSNWKGPYTIIKKINDLVYRIQLSPRSKPKVVHLERLAKYTGHNPPDWFVVEDPLPRTEDVLVLRSVIRDE
ncbi:hypothetical protein NQ318_013514 [Aromia moschata]|uniref:Uncharacterized protein n=1 Tax=Aromia moschata TaxID=1265417 RepID=A0AAV8YCL7_9CUCU|nr:hypothetical protein NQ318_013514 [Aromia moschata]